MLVTHYLPRTGKAPGIPAGSFPAPCPDRKRRLAEISVSKFTKYVPLPLRYKYPAFWVSVEQLYRATCADDTESGASRGIVIAWVSDYGSAASSAVDGAPRATGAGGCWGVSALRSLFGRRIGGHGPGPAGHRFATVLTFSGGVLAGAVVASMMISRRSCKAAGREIGVGCGEVFAEEEGKPVLVAAADLVGAAEKQALIQAGL